MTSRIETDSLGEYPVPEEALYGIHTARALDNFSLSGRPVHPALIRGFGHVKRAAAVTNHALGYLKDPEGVAQAIVRAAEEMSEGQLTAHIVVDALQGGAGTSTNMNVNEVIARRAGQLMDGSAGAVCGVSPSAHVNLHQSTNDTFPTALRVGAIQELKELEAAVIRLQEVFQEKERAFADVVKVGRTEMQDAVLITLGREMGAFADVLSRDRWRIYKCEERLRVVNLGGTAVGTGLGAPRQYIFSVVEALKAATGIGFARAENLVDATGNADVFVEVSGMLKALAVSLMKMSSDLRFLSSGPEAGIGEIALPPRQEGSSIMPGKVNPVIPEAVTQVAMQVIGSDTVIALAAASGNLELNPFMPLIADHLLCSITLLGRACRILADLCIRDLTVRVDRVAGQVQTSTATATALVESLGYDGAARVAAEAAEKGISIREVVVSQGQMTAGEFDQLVSPPSVCRLGSR